LPDKSPNQDQERKTDASVKPREIGWIENQKEAEETKTAPNKTQTSSDKFLRRAGFIVDVLIFIAVGSYTVVAWQQWTEMKLDRRAWVSVQNINGFPEVGKPFRVTIAVTNTGRTFAKHLKVIATGGAFDAKQTPNFAAEIKQSAERQNPKNISNVLLAPNAVAETTANQRDKTGIVSIASTPDIDALKDAIRNEKVRVLIFGEVTYEDIFHRPHWLIFCDRLVYDPFQSENSGWSWVTYEKWNDTSKGEPPK
jgi:hypothetical protein